MALGDRVARNDRVALGMTAKCRFLATLGMTTATLALSTPVRAQSIFHESDAWLAAGFVGATIAMFPLDRRIERTVRDSALLASSNAERAARTFGFLGSPGPFIAAGAMYAAGRLTDTPRLTHLSVHMTEAVIVGAVTAGLLKATLGRARPWATADTNPRDFGLLRGFTSDRYQAFPSGHSTIAFAVAAAVTAETSEWWPETRWIIGPLLYGGATLTGVSRMYENKHWASDVVMGAAIGVFAGLKTVRFTHTRAGNRLDRWLMREHASRVVYVRLDGWPSTLAALATARVGLGSLPAAFGTSRR